MSDKLRLFVAVDVPLEHREWIARETSGWRAQVPSARWTEVRNQHLTLKFLGWAAADARDDIQRACEAVALGRRAASIRLASPGAFPTARRARVLWIGVEDPAGLLTSLAADLDRAFEPLGFAAEQRSFTAHLTLARLKVPARVELPDLNAARLGEFTVDRLVLWRSHLGRGGAEYERVGEWPLNE